MSGGRQALVARSIAALDDPASIESRSFDEVLAELGALGVDPKASIAVAKKLAAAQSSPADRLIARLEDGEEIDDDIQALETANLAEIGAKVPTGVAASIAADAKRQSGQPTNLTRLKPAAARRWGGAVAGVAACLALFVLTRPDQLAWMEGVEEAAPPVEMRTAADAERDDADAKPAPAPAPAARGRALEESEAPAPEALAPSLDRKRQDRPPAADAAEALAAVPVAPKSRPAVSTSAAVSKSVGPQESEAPHDRATASIAPPPEPYHQPLAGPALPPEVMAEEAPAAEFRGLASIQNSLGARTPASSALAPAIKGPARQPAVLIVDPELAPAVLKEKARSLPAGDLIDRLDEARSLLGPRPLVALVTVLRDGKVIDAAVTPREPTRPATAVTALADDASPPRPSPDAIERFELVELPEKP